MTDRAKRKELMAESKARRLEQRKADREAAVKAAKVTREARQASWMRYEGPDEAELRKRADAILFPDAGDDDDDTDDDFY